MAFVKKTWKDRIVQYANRRLLTKSGGEVEQVTVTRDEGTISEAGDKFDAATMNDLENRIDNAIVELITDKLNKSDLIKDAANYTLNDMRTPGFYSGGFTDSPDSSISSFGFAIVTGLPNTNNTFQLFVTQKWNGNFGIYARTSIDGTTWNVWRFISGTSSNVKSQITFNENVTNTNTQAWVKNGNLIIYYQGENKAHGVNDVLFTLPSSLRPSITSYPPFVINGGAFGAVEIAKETGIAKIAQLSNNATGRVYFHCVIPLF